VGVMMKKTQNSSYNRRDQDRIFMPASTFASVFGVIHVLNILFTPADPTQGEAVVQQVREVLGKRYRFDPGDKDAVWIWDTGEFDRFMFYFFLAFNIFMGIIGGFTLGVGGIGVANIMFIVVQERIREIGIRRAVGAKRSSIMFQFFMETFFIIAVGSTIGFLIAAAIAEALQYVPIKDFVGAPVISWEVAVVTAAVLGLIGLAAGLFPARRAANLDVVECLRT
jgi:putative ABC transport system permease protein